MKQNVQPWPSAKALTVFNVLKLRGTKTMTVPQVLEYLREHWDPEYSAEWVSDGVAWLVGRGFLRWQGEQIEVAAFAPNGRIANLVKSPDESDLVLA